MMYIYHSFLIHLSAGGHLGFLMKPLNILHNTDILNSLPGEGNGNRLQYSCLGNSMDRDAWQATVRGITKSQTQLSN